MSLISRVFLCILADARPLSTSDGVPATCKTRTRRYGGAIEMNVRVTWTPA
jgi:hypothetical protein